MHLLSRTAKHQGGTKKCCVQCEAVVGWCAVWAGVPGLVLKSMLLLVTLSRSNAGASLLPGSDSAVRQWQVGCGTPQPSPLSRAYEP